MPILSMDADKLIWMCQCNTRSTYNFNYGAINTKVGPFVLKPNDTLMVRFDNDGGNDGTTETITFNDGDFADWNNITTNQLIVKLNNDFIAGIAYNDFGAVLIQSKITGPTSCVEVIDGTSRTALGYKGYGGNHYCCGRLCLGYYPLNDRKYQDVIVLRACQNCNSQTTLFRHHIDFSDQASIIVGNLHRKAVNSLALHLKNSGWVDQDMQDVYDNETYQPTETLTDFPNTVVVLYNYEDLIKNKT